MKAIFSWFIISAFVAGCATKPQTAPGKNAKIYYEGTGSEHDVKRFGRPQGNDSRGHAPDALGRVDEFMVEDSVPLFIAGDQCGLSSRRLHFPTSAVPLLDGLHIVDRPLGHGFRVRDEGVGFGGRAFRWKLLSRHLIKILATGQVTRKALKGL